MVSKSITKIHNAIIYPVPSKPIEVGYDPVSYVTAEITG